MNKRLNSSCMIQPLQHMKGSYQNMQNQKIPSDTWWENEQQQTSGVKRGLGWKVVSQVPLGQSSIGAGFCSYLTVESVFSNQKV